uniref:AlNc14C121G6665 protein n=1 Tax=Albugo laibachii Nc14 TaxID=890382 RepID=F0WJD7_9STRA|nr:AlNc14C121G6665 [Albugo laibachii Nc14]|eukprot:CCA21385.1 AlNc14C121G6665 [Albugo laibachii Nc14]
MNDVNTDKSEHREYDNGDTMQALNLQEEGFSLSVNAVNESLLKRGIAMQRIRRNSSTHSLKAEMDLKSPQNIGLISSKIFDDNEDENLQNIITKHEISQRFNKTKQLSKRNIGARPFSKPIHLERTHTDQGANERIESGDRNAQYDIEQQMLIFCALVTQWTRHQQMLAFRQWQNHNVAMRTNVNILYPVISDLKNEAKRLLCISETARIQQNLISTGSSTPNQTIVYPYTFTLRDLDVLNGWATQCHPKTFHEVNESTLRYLLRFMRFRQYDDGEALFLEGDRGDTFYIVHHGTIAVFVGIIRAGNDRLYAKRESQLSHGTQSVNKQLLRQKSSTVSRGVPYITLGKRVFTYRTGESFGETAMFSLDAVRTASAVAVGHCEVCEIPKEIYCKTLLKYHRHIFERSQKINFLQRVSLFRDWPRERLGPIADILTQRKLNFGDILFTEQKLARLPPNQKPEEGGPRIAPNTTCCYFILSGSVKLTKRYTNSPEINQNRMDIWHSQFRSPIQVQELHATDTIALEILLNWSFNCKSEQGNGMNEGTDYTAVAASATVELYALEEVDAQRLFASPNFLSMMEKVKVQVDQQKQQRKRRYESARQTLDQKQLMQSAEFERLRLVTSASSLYADKLLAVGLPLNTLSPLRPRLPNKFSDFCVDDTVSSMCSARKLPSLANRDLRKLALATNQSSSSMDITKLEENTFITIQDGSHFVTPPYLDRIGLSNSNCGIASKYKDMHSLEDSQKRSILKRTCTRSVMVPGENQNENSIATRHVFAKPTTLSRTLQQRRRNRSNTKFQLPACAQLFSQYDEFEADFGTPREAETKTFKVDWDFKAQDFSLQLQTSTSSTPETILSCRSRSYASNQSQPFRMP